MNLRTKILLLLTGTLAALLVVVHAVLSQMILGGANSNDRQIALNERNAVRDIVAFAQEELSEKLKDWAYWDDTYQYVQDKNQEYAVSNLNDDSISNLKVDVFIYTDLNNQVVFSEGFDYKSNTALMLPFDLNPQGDLLRPVLDLPNETSTNSGIILPSYPFNFGISRSLMMS